MSGWGWFILVIILLIPAAYFGYIFYRRRQAAREGFAPPSFNPFAASNADPSAGASHIYPAPSGAWGWVKDKYNSVVQRGGRAGQRRMDDGDAGYEATGRRPRGRDVEDGDGDGAWDTRFGGSGGDSGGGGYYEEQELGLHAGGDEAHEQERERDIGYTGAHGGGGGGGVVPSYGAPPQHDDEHEDGRGHAQNPFGDHAEVDKSLRGVSPRPHEDDRDGHKPSNAAGGGLTVDDSSPTERRSMFREENL